MLPVIYCKNPYCELESRICWINRVRILLQIVVEVVARNDMGLFVFQQIPLVNDIVRENICLGKFDATYEEIICYHA